MDRSEQALASLLEDEPLEETWTVDTINRGFELSPPGMGDTETLGLTDRRLVWLAEELESVDVSDIRSMDVESVNQAPSSALVLLGPVLGLLGAPLSAALWLFTSLSIEIVLAPLAIGALVFVVGLVSSQFGSDDDAEVYHYLELRTVDSTVQVYATPDLVETIRDRIADRRE